ncbi:MAG: type II toxin-antitoxin system Phd/YefM family antitoxin [Spirochaetia bacterium]|nr:type II toxin-antitoxin system Phd/YefM family antitoxin [Spirochaetia bacterium]
MLAVSVGEVKNKLSYFLHLIESRKESIQITRHGKPIAFITDKETNDKFSKRALFSAGLTDWHDKYGHLFTNKEIDKIFKRDRTIDPDIRHPEDFTI